MADRAEVDQREVHQAQLEMFRDHHVKRAYVIVDQLVVLSQLLDHVDGLQEQVHQLLMLLFDLGLR